MSDVASKNVPRHLGLILDGNRRWAKANGKPTFEGHRKGYDNLKDIAKLAFDKGVEYVSAFIFSTENWKRSKDEVKYLMDLAYWVAKNDVKELDKNNIRVKFLGEREPVDPKILKAIDAAEERTKNNTGGTLGICFNYGGQQEIATAIKKMVKAGVNLAEITVDKIAEYLYVPELPALDLIVRTSGENRLSNFMLWRAAYSEFAFVETYWPDFNEAELDKVLADFSTRHRRFGS